MRGDEFMLKSNQFMCFLYEQAAIGSSARVHQAEVEAFLRVSRPDYEKLKSHLREAGLVAVREGWARGTAGGRSAWREIWLTPNGVQEALKLASAVRRQLEDSSKGRLGFQEPADADK